MTDTDAIASAFDALRRVGETDDYATSCAVGVWTDNPASPGVTAVVFQGQLYALIIPDAYQQQMDPQVLTDMVRATVLNAVIEWERDRKRLLAASARSVSP